MAALQHEPGRVSRHISIIAGYFERLGGRVCSTSSRVIRSSRLKRRDAGPKNQIGHRRRQTPSTASSNSNNRGEDAIPAADRPAICCSPPEECSGQLVAPVPPIPGTGRRCARYCASIGRGCALRDRRPFRDFRATVHSALEEPAAPRGHARCPRDGRAARAAGRGGSRPS